MNARRRPPWPPHGGWGDEPQIAAVASDRDLASDPAADAESTEIVPDEPVSFVAKGRNGQLTVTPTKIVISRKGVLGFSTHGHAGAKEVDIDQITSIQFKKPGQGTVGYIQFAFRGGTEAKRGITQAVQDENTVLFAQKVEADFIKAKELIDTYRAARKREPAGAPQGSLTPVEQLEKLAALYDRGLVTEDEFNAKKKELLGL